MTSGPLTVIFVGAIVSDARCERTIACSVAGNKFQRNLVRALGTATGRPVEVLSYEPAATFPRERSIRFAARRERMQPGDVDVTYVPFLNLPGLKQVTQAIGVFLGTARALRRHRHGRVVVLVYNATSQHALPAAIAARLAGVQVVALIADTPHDYHTFRGFRGLFQRVDFALQLQLIRRVDALIPLTDAIQRDFAPASRALRIEGGVDADEVPLAGDAGPAMDPELRVCLFSGILNELNGIGLLLEAFALVHDPRFRLWIYGRGELEPLVRAAAARDPRIEFRGFAANRDVTRAQRSAALLVNPRPSHRTVTRYTFPSKLLEYMLSGRPVVTTLLPGIPAEYLEYVYPIREETPAGLAAVLVRVGGAPAAEREAAGSRAREFVLRDKSWHAQAERIAAFLHSL